EPSSSRVGPGLLGWAWRSAAANQNEGHRGYQKQDNQSAAATATRRKQAHQAIMHLVPFVPRTWMRQMAPRLAPPERLADEAHRSGVDPRSERTRWGCPAITSRFTPSAVGREAGSWSS